jgi:hypothetical protein
MEKTLLSRFKPTVGNFLEANSLQTALENLPNDFLPNGIPEGYRVISSLGVSESVKLELISIPGAVIKIPEGAKNCYVRAGYCEFEFKDRKYRIE